MSPTRSVGATARCVLRALALAALLPAAVYAQGAWPTKPIKIIIPSSPGGSNDNISRMAAERVGARLGQPIIVENKPGAGGIIGIDFVSKSPADGYTMVFFSTSLTTNTAAGKKLPYDLVRDFEPAGTVAAGHFVAVVANSLNVKTLREFIDLARAKPNTITYASSGVGGLNHVGTELIASVADIKLVHVPYKGMGPALTDLMGGQVMMALPSLASLAPFIKSPRLKALAITSLERSPLAAELPTFSESGMPGFKLELWWGLLVATKTPPAVIKRFNEELNVVLKSPEAREQLAKDGAIPYPGTPEDFRNVLKGDIARWGQVIRDAKIPMD